uniref:PDZ domain-containing protein n=1 Tax=Phytophthora ramorum TaxID=164328 RepID=H3GIN4_PHYRM
MQSAEENTAAVELARNLPALVAQLKALREDMERKSKLYDALLLSAADSLEPSADSHATSAASFDLNQSGMRGSIFTPFANSQLDPRASQMTLEDLSALDAALDDSRYSNTLVSRQSSIMMRQQQQQQRRVQQRPQQRPSYSMGHMGNGRVGPDAYTVMWVSGECGISLRNFSRKDNKVGAQIALLQHADGVTTGISNCRLGDQLVSINDDRVDSLRFREIVEKLKTTRRPISLGFRTNQNVQTSPRGTTSPSNGSFSHSTSGSGRSSNFFRGGSQRSKKKASPASSAVDRHSVSEASHSNSNGFFDDDESSDIVHETIEHLGYGDSVSSHFTRSSSSGAMPTADRGTTTSVVSAASTMSEDVEVWCREQEEMHSDIIVLLTETVLRCEKLQQENLDQLQNLMQLSAGSPSDRSSAASSYAGTENAGKNSQAEEGLEVDATVPATTSPAASPRE